MNAPTQAKKIGFWPITSLVSGNLIGSGVFMLPVTLAAFGSVSILGWIVTSIGAIFLALVFAKLSASIAKPGGPHVYVRQAFGNTASYYVGWSYWVMSWISNAAVVVSTVGYLNITVGGLSTMQIFGIELGIITSITLINLLGIKIAGHFGVILTFLKLLPLLIVPTIGLFFIELDNFVPLNPTEYNVNKALLMVVFITIWGFIGLETGAVPSSEVKTPSKTIPRATIAGTAIATLVYILGTVAIIGAIPKGILINSTAPYADLANVIFHSNRWGTIVAIVAIICTLGTYNGWTLVVGRIAYGAAEDGLFPKFFKKTTATGAPFWGILISSLCTAPLTLLTLNHNLIEQFNDIIDISVTLILLIYLLCVLAYFKLIVFASENIEPGKLLVGLGALAFNLLSLWAADFKMLLLSLIITMLGMPMWLYMRKA